MRIRFPTKGSVAVAKGSVVVVAVVVAVVATVVVDSVGIVVSIVADGPFIDDSVAIALSDTYSTFPSLRSTHCDNAFTCA
jgi:hypothetical protein